jgi:hypothetical protein
MLYSKVENPVFSEALFVKALGTGDLDSSGASKLLANPKTLVSISGVAEVKNILQKDLRQDSSESENILGHYCIVGKGAASGLDDVFVLLEDTAIEYQIEQSLLVPVAEDDTMDAYNIEFRDRYLLATQRGIDISKYPHALRYLKQNKSLLSDRYAVQNEGVEWYEIVRFNRDIFDGTGGIIFCYYRSARSKFAFSNEPYCSLTTTFAIRPRSDCPLSPLYILALLNSKCLEFKYFKQYGKGMGGVVEYSSTRLEQAPIRHITFNTPAARRELMAGEALSLVAAGDESALLGFVASRLSAQPEESDVIHDLLTFLAERMIELNKQKQAEMKRFIGWLEGLLKVSVNDLNGKSKLKNYLGDYQKSEPELTFGELEDILYKNKGKLGIPLSDARLMAKLREEYEKSLAVLRPLKSALAWTDGVIDQVVYRLYGLTDEEVKVVEGKG